MKIRSITYFDALQWPLREDLIHQAGEIIQAARGAYEEAGFAVQTTRFASTPFPLVLGDKVSHEAVEFAVALEKLLVSAGFDFGSIGPATPEVIESYQVIPQVLASTNNIFVAGIISSVRDGISLEAIKQCASVIKLNALIEPDGFGNLRFAALANVPAGSPFLPAAFQELGSRPGFAIATEAADLAVTAFENAANLAAARDDLIKAIENKAGEIQEIGQVIAAQYNLQFLGIDFSLAPFPAEELSIGTAVKKLGVGKLGGHGSLAAIAILAETIERAQYLKVGFNGVMLPVLEDVVLSGSASSGRLTINDLLLYSTVCGTGLDTIPLPESVTAEQIYALLLDLAVLAQRLGKSLTARLMPIPGKRAGETTEFDFEYFANSAIMDLRPETLTGFLLESDRIHIQDRNYPPGG